MKKCLLLLSVIILTACAEKGTTVKLTEDNNSNIEVYRHFYSDGNYVYVSRFKDQPNVSTTTWSEKSGKHIETKSNVTIFENDSIKVILK